MKNLTRPKSAIEYAVYTRVKAACTAVGAGSRDAAYVDAIRPSSTSWSLTRG